MGEPDLHSVSHVVRHHGRAEHPGKAGDKRAELTYKDAEATFHEARQIQIHLKQQDDAMNAMLERLEKLEAGLTKI